MSVYIKHMMGKMCCSCVLVNTLLALQAVLTTRGMRPFSSTYGGLRGGAAQWSWLWLYSAALHPQSGALVSSRVWTRQGWELELEDGEI